MDRLENADSETGKDGTVTVFIYLILGKGNVVLVWIKGTERIFYTINVDKYYKIL